MKTKVLLALILSVFITAAALAQETEKKFAFEISGGPSFPTREFVEDIRMGIGFEGTLQYRFLPFTSVYGGWGANWLSSESDISENNMDYEETGYVLGIDFRKPAGSSNLSYYIRAGVLYNHIETEDSEGVIIYNSMHGFGYQLAGGIDLKLGRNWSLVPGIKYNSLLSETETNGVGKQIKYQYISLRIGISKQF